MRVEMSEFPWEENKGGRSQSGLQWGCCRVMCSRQSWALGVGRADGDKGGC